MDFIRPENVVITPHIADGYIELKIPFYSTIGKNDEALLRGSYFSVNGNKCLRFWSSNSAEEEDEWQKHRADDLYEIWREPVNSETVRVTGGRWFKMVNEEVCAIFKVYLAEKFLGKDLNYSLHLNPDENSDGMGSEDNSFDVDGQITGVNYSNPSLSYKFSNTVGKYDVDFSLNSPVPKTGSTYRWDDSLESNFTQSPQTTKFSIIAENKSRSLSFYYKVSAYQNHMVSASINLPAYSQATNFKAVEKDNADTEITWNANTTNLGTNFIKGDKFEVQRADNKEFNNPVSVKKVDYDSTKPDYSFIDETSNENLNGTFYYRIRRTKTGNEWGWDLSQSTTVNLKMVHKYILDAQVKFDDSNNIATISWEYNEGNVWTEGSEVLIERTNITGGGVEIISISEDGLASLTYSEELYQMCNKFTYKIYLKPGGAKYSTQNAISVEGDNVVPVETGNILSINASKGYFSNRTEISWKTDEKPIDYFTIKNRIYQSGSSFKQNDIVDGAIGSISYQYIDEQSIPGIIYEYQIIGSVQCADVIAYTDTLYTYGFRTPTGDIYGRVTFENGQAEENVEVRLESDDGIVGKSLNFTSNKFATVDNTSFLETNTDSITIQAWLAPNKADETSKIFSKPGMYELGMDKNHFYFSAGDQKVSSTATIDDLRDGSEFVHLSGVYSKKSLLIYINGKLIDSKDCNESVVGNENQATLGDNFTGLIGEVRVWNRALSEKEIVRDYNRYLTGGENGLIAYWNFDYAKRDEFYDRSYKSNTYNENHGQLNGVNLSETIPTNNQLCYKGVSGVDGSYSIRSVPYFGNGTAYKIIPRLGIHQFESQQEVRFIGEGSQNFTVNFTDKSSFKVSGTITYQGGTIPVEGVSFAIDGIVAMDTKGNLMKTNDKGEFEITVPVGSHEVIAEKANHVFGNEGRITDSNGVNLNYQDEVIGLVLHDITTVRYIGRVAGGAVQEAFPLGHSLSTNNLADGITVTLKRINPAYKIRTNKTDSVFNHFIPSNKKGTGWNKSNKVEYGIGEITIYPNENTGEFIADVIPESFTVEVNVPGHGDIPGAGEILDFSKNFLLENEVHSYIDSTFSNAIWKKTAYSDTVFYNYAQKFIKRYSPAVRISQIDKSRSVVPYYGDTIYTSQSIDGTTTSIKLYENSSYLFNHPVFSQNETYNFQVKVFEKYIYNNTEGGAIDEVPTQDARIEFTNNLSVLGIEEVSADSLGRAKYSFQTTEPELTSAKRSFSAKITYGSEGNGTSINWDGTFDGIILGAIQTGRDFITGGPNKVLTILRDPPGSNSYSYLEKGVSITETSTYSGSYTNEGSETWTKNLGLELVTFAGVGAGVINTTEVSNGFSIGVSHEETYNHGSSKETVTTTTTKFQTSDDPGFVGADGDVFVGYSTNIAYGATECINIISKEQYDVDPAKYTVYDKISPVSGSWLLVNQTGLGISQTFSTLFAYPQRHIVDRLLPEMEALRNNFLMQAGTVSMEQLQELANSKDTVFYVSHLSSDDINFGKSNIDEVFETDPDSYDTYNGASYQIIFPERENYTRSDTILYLNLSITNWHEQLANNEEAKLKAKLLQNYSFHGGSPVEYSESFSKTESYTNSFSIMIGGNLSNEFGAENMGKGFNFNFEESVSTEHGKEWTGGTENSKTKGFVLADEGDDYISVDVFREVGTDTIDNEHQENEFYTSFIFRTQAGATSCPYEGERVTKYFEPGKHILDQATKKIEVPEIDVEKDFIENVASGSTANLMMYLRNNSEIKQDNWYTLKIVNESNPNGAKLIIDGAPIGNGRDFLVSAGETLFKTLEVGKGSVMNYDNLQLVLESQCEDNIADTLNFSVHFTPSCSDAEIEKPSDQWTYNTKLPVLDIDGVDKHYMDVRISGFDINYDSFNHIKLQYKSSAESDDSWISLMKFYSDSLLYKEALEKGNADFINPADAGIITYVLKMDELPDQLYDLRTVSVCLINNKEIENISETVSGIKDMYRPRLFGSPQPANGILTIEDDIKLIFNEQIAEGLLTKNNFQVTGIRNGAQTDHSVSIRFDGINDCMVTELDKNLTEKDLTVEMWIKADEAKNVTLFNQGNSNESIEMSLTQDNYLQIRVGDNVVSSKNAIPFEKGSWAHVAMVYTKDGYVSGYYNYNEVISGVEIGKYSGIGNFVLGRDIRSGAKYFKGLMHGVRVWDKELTSGEIQINSLAKLSGNESGLYACYPMDKAKGGFAEDKARGANMIMEGCSWVVPDGRSIALDGSSSYVKINTGSSAVITKSMDYTIEFWFKGEPGQSNTTLLSNGRGDGKDMGGSENLFSIEIDSNGKLCFKNNGFISTVTNSCLDNNWHHFAINIGRAIGRGQIYIDGNLVNYFDSKQIGGVASAFMYVGARGWYAKDNAGSLHLGNFFKGTIDELRIWNLYKYEQQIQNNNNTKLDGTEMGLLAYYPFEYYKDWQGQKELAFTLADMKIQHDSANRVPDAENKGAKISSDIPAVKDKGPISNLDFDFVVNDDALIINLGENLEKIEKTIVTFTVDGVQDINGNENSSPITWSAYIDRNQLKWSEIKITANKPIDEAYEFTIQAINQSGSIQNFNIGNMPSWMQISPTNGIINPSSSIDITFKINEGLNVGNYEEVVYLTNSDNVSETLEVNVKAKGETPDWTVNPKDYDYSMSVYAKLRINNIFSNDSEDMIAAFAGGKCVGLANVQYEQRNDMWYAFLTTYSDNSTYSNLIFKIWDSSTGTIYQANAGKQIDFRNNGTVGTPVNPQIFDAKELIYQDIELSPGWNWISFNVASPTLNSLSDVLANMEFDSNNYFKSESNNISANYSSNKQKWIEEKPFTLNNTVMYKVSSSVSQTIDLAGVKIKPSSELISIQGDQWNYISYLPTVRLKLDEALNGYDAKEEDVIKSQDGFAMYSENIGWLGSLTFLKPNKGYMLYRNEATNVNLKYPDSNGSMSTKSGSLDPSEEYVNKNYSGNMNLIATTDIAPQSNDRILSYVGNILSSETTIRNINSNELYFITISGNEKNLVSFVLEREGRIIGRTANPIQFASNWLSGTVSDPYVLNFVNNEDKVIAYPNPCIDKLKISLSSKKQGSVLIHISDINGKLLIVKNGLELVDGELVTEVECSKLPSGLYFVTVIIEGTSQVIKIVKQ